MIFSDFGLLNSCTNGQDKPNCTEPLVAKND